MIITLSEIICFWLVLVSVEDKKEIRYSGKLLLSSFDDLSVSSISAQQGTKAAMLVGTPTTKAVIRTYRSFCLSEWKEKKLEFNFYAAVFSPLNLF